MSNDIGYNVISNSKTENNGCFELVFECDENMQESQELNNDYTSTVEESSKSKKRRVQKYRRAWERLPEFKSWLKPVPSNHHKAHCIACNKNMVAEVMVLRKHALAKRHAQNVCGIRYKVLREIMKRNTETPSESNEDTDKRGGIINQEKDVQLNNADNNTSSNDDNGKNGVVILNDSPILNNGVILNDNNCENVEIKQEFDIDEYNCNEEQIKTDDLANNHTASGGDNNDAGKNNDGGDDNNDGGDGGTVNEVTDNIPDVSDYNKDNIDEDSDNNPITKYPIMPIQVGMPAPKWKGQALWKGKVVNLKLKDYRGRYLVMFFYYENFSELCSVELISMSDKIGLFKGLNAEVVACSVDAICTHLAWTKMNREDGGIPNIQIPLLSDPSKEISRKYGTYIRSGGNTHRATFIVDREGILRHISMNDVRIGRNIDEILRLISALQYCDATGSCCSAE